MYAPAMVEYDQVVGALPAYEVSSELGRGAYGVVLAGRHRQLGRLVAIKQLPLGSDPALRTPPLLLQMRLTVAKWSFDLSLSARLSIVVALIVTGVVIAVAWLEVRSFERDMSRERFSQFRWRAPSFSPPPCGGGPGRGVPRAPAGLPHSAHRAIEKRMKSRLKFSLLLGFATAARPRRSRP